jgi:acyl dehydratase
MENTINPVAGAHFEQVFSFTQEDVIRFAEVTGDNNPVHLDEAYAASTLFKRPILHGFLAGSVFSRVFGTKFPGRGTIYLSQQLSFKRPMYADERYTASFDIKETNAARGTLFLECRIFDASGKICLEGEARLMNKAIFSEPG